MKFLSATKAGVVNSFRVAGVALAAVAAPIGFREILLFGGAMLLSVGAWQVYPPAAFIIPGAILVYVSVFGTA